MKTIKLKKTVVIKNYKSTARFFLISKHLRKYSD